MSCTHYTQAPGLALVSRDRRTQLLKLAARTLHGNAVNHVKEYFFKRLCKWCFGAGAATPARLGHKWTVSLAAKVCAPDKGFTAPYVAIDTDCLKELLKVCHQQPRKRKAPKLEAPNVANTP